jgi:hypothetical protein
MQPAQIDPLKQRSEVATPKPATEAKLVAVPQAAAKVAVKQKPKQEVRAR